MGESVWETRGVETKAARAANPEASNGAAAELTSGGAAGFADGYLDRDGVRLHYVEKGAGDVVLMLHGFPQFWWLWRAQIDDLGADHRAVAPDMRGYNLSSAPTEVEAYRMRHLIADVRALIEHLGEDRVTLVGHDWGGIVAWAFAIKHPELLDRLVICDAPPPFTWGRELERTPRQREAVRYMEDFSKPAPLAEELLTINDYSGLATLALERGIEQGYLDEGDRERYRAAWGRPGALTGGLNYYRAARMGEQVQFGQPPEAQARLRSMRVEVPTLVIWGGDDRFLLPGLTDGLEEWVPDVRIEVLPGAGHWIPQERAEEVSALIRGFLPA
jgi:pimeloyl-ACP methyl ester carboxylesterase